MNDLKGMMDAAGDLDPEFNGGGILRFNYTEDNQVRDGVLLDVAVGDNGRIYIAGSVGTPLNSEYAITVLEADGSFAESFGVGGTLFGSFPGVRGRSSGRCIKVESDGVLLLGDVQIEKNGDVVRCPGVVRYLLDGTLDTAYGIQGYCIINPDFDDSSEQFMHPNFPANWSSYNDNTYLAVFRVAGEGTEMVVTCVDSEGHVVTRFGNKGTARVKDPRGPQLEQILVTADGIHLAGAFTGEGSTYSTFCRLDFSGALDVTFGQSGFTPRGVPFSFLYSLLQQRNKKILGVGRSVKEREEGEPAVPYLGALESLDKVGAIDAEFNGGRPLYTELSYATYWSLSAVQADGKIVTFGGFSDPREESFKRDEFAPLHPRHSGLSALSNGRLVLARFLEGGSFDTSFGRVKPGWIEFNLPGYSNIYALAIQQLDNKTVLVGTLGSEFIVLRFKG